MATKKRAPARRRAEPDNYKINITVDPRRKDIRGPRVNLKGDVDLLYGRMMWLLALVGLTTARARAAATELLAALEEGIPDDFALARAWCVLAPEEMTREPTANARQLAMMRHATGGQYDAHRNYYCVEPDHEDRGLWEQLAEMGLAALGEPDGRENNKVFHVTELGYRFVYGKPHREPAWCHECETALTDAVQPGPCESCGAEFCGECLLNHDCEDA